MIYVYVLIDNVPLRPPIPQERRIWYQNSLGDTIFNYAKGKPPAYPGVDTGHALSAKIWSNPMHVWAAATNID